MDLFLILTLIAMLVAIIVSFLEYQEKAKESVNRPLKLLLVIVSILVATVLSIVGNRSNEEDMNNLREKLEQANHKLDTSAGSEKVKNDRLKEIYSKWRNGGSDYISYPCCDINGGNIVRGEYEINAIETISGETEVSVKFKLSCEASYTIGAESVIGNISLMIGGSPKFSYFMNCGGSHGIVQPKVGIYDLTRLEVQTLFPESIELKIDQ